MSDTLLALLPSLGLPVLALVVGLGTLGVPLMPATLMVLVAGTLAGAGELPLVATALTALVTAVTVDNLGFGIGRLARQNVLGRESALMAQADAYLSRRGGPAVFFSRWLVAPLGPPLNLVAGAGDMPWRRFVVWDIAGEIVWVTAYMTLGASFAPFVPQIAELSGDITALLACLALAAVAARLLLRRAPRARD